jgi:hypothetical protein
MKFNIRLVGRCLEILFKGLIIFTVISSVLNVFFPNLFLSEQMIANMENLYGFNITKISILSRVFLYTIGALGTTILLYGFWVASKIAKLMSTRELLSETSVKLFQQLKNILLCWGLYSMFQLAFTYAFFMPKMDLKTKILACIFTGLGNLMFYGILAIITAVIKRAARLKSEQDLTI